MVTTYREIQAEGRTDDLINELCVVRDFSQDLINELKKM